MSERDDVTEMHNRDSGVPQLEAIPPSPTFLSSLRNRLRWPTLSHFLKTVILGMVPNVFDVYSDIGVGIEHGRPKNVTRVFTANDTVPDNCIALPPSLPSTEGGHDYKCLERDLTWAGITFGCIQLPAVVLAICFAVGVVMLRCGKHSKFAKGYTKKVLLGCLLLLIIPFPLVVFAEQVTSLFMPDSAQMELLSAIFLFGEGALEASPQLLLLLYTIVSDRERDIPLIQKQWSARVVFSISRRE